MAVLQILCIAGIAWAARRRGRAVLPLAMAAAALLVWSLGSEMVIDPWQPNVVLVPFLLFLVLEGASAAMTSPCCPARWPSAACSCRPT